MNALWHSTAKDYVPPNTPPAEKQRLLSIAAPSSISHDEKPEHAQDPPSPSPSPSPALRDWDAVAILPAGRRGNGVFARASFDRGHRIIVETPILSCVHWTLRNGTGRRTVAQDWARLPPAQQRLMKGHFARLRDVPTSQSQDSQLLPLDGAPLLLLPRHRRVLERFVEEYAFWDPQRARAHVYLLVSHINHACRRCANAEQWTDSAPPHAITVKLVKPVERGEEIFINYGRRTPFGCALCGPRSWRDRVSALGCGLFS